MVMADVSSASLSLEQRAKALAKLCGTPNSSFELGPSWVSFGFPLGSSWLEFDQTQSFSQLEPSFPIAGEFFLLVR